MNHLLTEKRVLMPPLHIKWGMAKQYVKSPKADDPISVCWEKYFQSTQLLRWRVVFSLVRKFAKWFRVLGLCGINVNLTKNVWDSFWAVVDGFLGNRKDDRYFIPCLTPSSVKKWHKREFPISQKIFSSQKNENNSHDQCTLENYYQL